MQSEEVKLGLGGGEHEPFEDEFAIDDYSQIQPIDGKPVWERLNDLEKLGSMPTLAIGDMPRHKRFPVTSAKRVVTRFGRRIVVVLENAFQVWLPDRFVNYFNREEDLQRLLETRMEYKGKVPLRDGSGKEKHDITFSAL